MRNPIIIVDYGMGNLQSVKRKFGRIGVASEISNAPARILNAEKLVLPGVGHFEKATKDLKSTGLWDALNEAVLVKKTPILGICLGLQLMAKHSEEGDVEGLGWFNADVIRFRVKDQLRHKVPHMGWNSISQTRPNALFEGLPANPEFYFVHSFHIQSHDPAEVLNYTHYEYDFPSAMHKNNIIGVQYHPEKSHDLGERMMLNFANL
jgi:imidazole glycerol-phosphate synthase subunit HisH